MFVEYNYTYNHEELWFRKKNTLRHQHALQFASTSSEFLLSTVDFYLSSVL